MENQYRRFQKFILIIEPSIDISFQPWTRSLKHNFKKKWRRYGIYLLVGWLRERKRERGWNAMASRRQSGAVDHLNAKAALCQRDPFWDRVASYNESGSLQLAPLGHTQPNRSPSARWEQMSTRVVSQWSASNPQMATESPFWTSPSSQAWNEVHTTSDKYGATTGSIEPALGRALSSGTSSGMG
jgi:hypothetical protein